MEGEAIVQRWSQQLPINLIAGSSPEQVGAYLLSVDGNGNLFVSGYIDYGLGWGNVPFDTSISSSGNVRWSTARNNYYGRRHIRPDGEFALHLGLAGDTILTGHINGTEVNERTIRQSDLILADVGPYGALITYDNGYTPGVFVYDRTLRVLLSSWDLPAQNVDDTIWGAVNTKHGIAVAAQGTPVTLKSVTY